MAANIDRNAVKNQAKNKDTSQQTLTLNFVPETQPYSKPTNMEEYIRTYFEGMNGINRRIIAEERKIIAQNRNTWENLTVEERDELLNERFIASDIRKKYNTNDEYWKEKTPWQAEHLIPSEELKPCPREDRTDSMSLNDSFSKPFHWATKSQRNIKFPAIKQERRKISTEPCTKSISKITNTATKDDETVKKLNNVEQSIKEKQIKTINEDIKGNGSEPEKSKVEEKQKTTSRNNENLNEPKEQEESMSEPPKPDEDELIGGSDNIFEFLQSWNP